MYVGARMAALEEKRLMTERGGKLDSDLWPASTLTISDHSNLIGLDRSDLWLDNDHRLKRWLNLFLGRLAVLKKKREIIAMKKLSRLMQDQRFGSVIHRKSKFTLTGSKNKSFLAIMRGKSRKVYQ